jgi:hypothetical protein
MKYKYLIKIFTKHLQTKFEIESDKEINSADELNKPIIDFLGKSDIDWEKNDLQYSSTVNGFYITYEEVYNGSGKYGAVREETQTRV